MRAISCSIFLVRWHAAEQEAAADGGDGPAPGGGGGDGPAPGDGGGGDGPAPRDGGKHPATPATPGM